MMLRFLGFALYVAAVPTMWSACVYGDPEGTEGTGVAHGHPETSISGIVRDAAGRPMEGLDLQLVTIGENGDVGELVPFRRGCMTGISGEFYMTGIPSGRYYLGANLIEPVMATVPRTFYPGTRTRERAIPLDVRAGRKMEGLTLVAPDYGAMRKFRILVIDQKGAPVPGASVTSDYPVGGVPGATAVFDRNLKTGPDGVALVEGFAGIWYRIGAQPNGCVWNLSHRRVVVPPGDKPVTILLVL